MKILDQKDFYEAGLATGRHREWFNDPDRENFKKYVKDDDVKKFYHSATCEDVHYYLWNHTHNKLLFSKYLNHFDKEKFRTLENATRKFPEEGRTIENSYIYGGIFIKDHLVSAINKIAARHPNGKIQTETHEMDHDDYVRMAADHVLRGVIDGVNGENNK